MYNIVFTSKAVRDLKKMNEYGLGKEVKSLMNLLRDNPSQMVPPYLSLVGELSGACSRRINFCHRLIYQVKETEETVKIISLWNY